MKRRTILNSFAIALLLSFLCRHTTARAPIYLLFSSFILISSSHSLDARSKEASFPVDIDVSSIRSLYKTIT
jgi:hypothetical protein